MYKGNMFIAAAAVFFPQRHDGRFPLKKTKKFDIINQLYQEEILRKIKKEG